MSQRLSLGWSRLVPLAKRGLQANSAATSGAPDAVFLSRAFGDTRTQEGSSLSL